jgi:NADH-quinone oxidoreductase subunit L
VILGCHHEQDMRKMGGLQKQMPVTRWAYLAATWAIAGFPWASGFFSKDEILWKAFTSHHLSFLGIPAPWLGPAIAVAGLVAATGTSFYMFRSYYMTFSGTYRGEAHAGHGNDHHGGTPRESPLSITFVLVVLGAGAVVAGVLGIPALWSQKPPILEHWLAPSLTAEVPFAVLPHWMEWASQGAGFTVGLIGWLFAMLLYKDARSTAPARLKDRFLRIWTVVYNKYYVDELYQLVVLRPTVALARALSWFDGHVIDAIVNAVATVGRGFGRIDAAIDTYFVDGAVTLVAEATLAGGRALRRVQTGRIQTYIYGALFGALVIVALNFLW